MIDAEVAALLEMFAEKVIQLPGVSRTRPEAFAEAKSELRGEMRKKALELRAAPPRVGAVAAIVIGDRFIASRRIPVISKSRRS